MILPRTSWLLPQRCLGAVLVLCPAGPEGLIWCVTVVMLIRAQQKCNREREELLELVLLVVYGRIWPLPRLLVPTAPGQGWHCRQGDTSLCWWPLVCPGAVGFPWGSRSGQWAQRATQHGRLSACAGAVLAGLSLASDTVLLWLLLCFCFCTL